MPWMVEIHAESTLRACSTMPSARSAPLMRDFSSAAALEVNVMASTRPMSSTAPLESACTMRRVSVNVLPLPAPAETASDASSVWMHLTCPG